VSNDWDDTVAALPGALESELRRGRAYLVVVRGTHVGRIYPVIEPDMVIGRGVGSDLQLEDDGVSRFHCKLRHEGLDIILEDLGSRNGTYRNGERVGPGTPALEEGDRLQIGTTSVLRFTYEEADVESSATPVPSDPNSSIDPLTGTHSRRYFVDQLQDEVAAALKRGSPLSLLLIDIDRFTDIGTERGQPFADQLTIRLAGHIRDSSRKGDIVARLAGAEFGLLSHSASPGDTFMMAERLRKSSSGVLTPADAPRPITLSIAIAALHELRIRGANDLLIAAGTALHRARAQGGDVVMLCTQDLLR
jgi:two-component system cell cycle response regulator